MCSSDHFRRGHCLVSFIAMIYVHAEIALHVIQIVVYICLVKLELFEKSRNCGTYANFYLIFA